MSKIFAGYQKKTVAWFKLNTFPTLVALPLIQTNSVAVNVDVSIDHVT